MGNKLSLSDTFLLSRCSRPVKVFRDGCYSYFPCGCCSSCQRRTNNKLCSSVHYNCDRYDTYYLSFSFDSKHVPLLKYHVVPFGDSYNVRFIYLNDETFSFTLPLSDKLILDLYKYFSHVSSDIFYKTKKLSKGKTINFTIPFKNFSKKIFIYTTGYIAVTDFDLFQTFLKSLRKSLWVQHGVLIKYVCTTEYGGKHFRPHFHALFHVTNIPKGIANGTFDSVFNTLCNKFWKFGTVYNSGSLNQSEYASRYVTNYLTASSSLPLFLRPLKFRQKTRHSLNYQFCLDGYSLQTFLSCPSSAIDSLSFRLSPTSDTIDAYKSLLRRSLVSQSFAKLQRLPQFTCHFLEKLSFGKMSFSSFFYGLIFSSQSFYRSQLLLLGINPVYIFRLCSYLPISIDISTFYYRDNVYLYDVYCTHLRDFSISYDKFILYCRQVSRLYRLYRLLIKFSDLCNISGYPPCTFFKLYFDAFSVFQLNELSKFYADYNELLNTFSTGVIYNMLPLSSSEQFRQRKLLLSFVKHKETSNLNFN